MLSCKMEPYRLIMIPEASGASKTRLTCIPGPDDYVEKAQNMSSGMVVHEWNAFTASCDCRASGDIIGQKSESKTYRREYRL